MFQGTKETFQQTSVSYENREYNFKPCHLSALLNPLAYPLHPIFRSRIDVNAWTVFNVDLDEVLFNRAMPCKIPICILCGIPFTIMNCSTEPVPQDFYWIIGHYNKVLFHPMLIDAQVFVRTVNAGKNSVKTEVTLSFLVARDAAHFRTFPRPVVGKSSGYFPRANCPSRVNYHVEETPTVPDRPPAKTPEFQPLNVLDPKTVARCAQIFTPGTSRSYFPAQASKNYSAYQDWVDFFEFKTNTMPSSGPYGSVIHVPTEQMLSLMTGAPLATYTAGADGMQAAPDMVQVGGIAPQPAYAAAPQMIQASYQPVPAYAAAPQMVQGSYQPVPTSTASGAPQMVPIPQQPGSAQAVQMVPVPSSEQTMKR
jgi:hypothetical protein